MGLSIMGALLGLGSNRNLVTDYMPDVWSISASAAFFRLEGNPGSMVFYCLFRHFTGYAIRHGYAERFHPFSLFVAFALAVAGFFFANQVLASSARVEESFGTALPGQPEAIAPTDMPIAGRAS